MFKRFIERLKLVNWGAVASSLLKTLSKEKIEVDSKYFAIKPAILSDDNLLRGLAALKTVLSFIPPAQVAAQVLSLGDMGFKLWKLIALKQEYAQFSIPPVGWNTIVFAINRDATLKSLLPDLSNREKVIAAYNDFHFITDSGILLHKYPGVTEDYAKAISLRNKALLDETIETISQKLIDHKSIPQVDTNLREAIEALKQIFPALRDWALLSSDGFNEVLDIVDTLV